MTEQEKIHFLFNKFIEINDANKNTKNSFSPGFVDSKIRYNNPEIDMVDVELSMRIDKELKSNKDNQSFHTKLLKQFVQLCKNYYKNQHSENYTPSTTESILNAKYKKQIAAIFKREPDLLKELIANLPTEYINKENDTVVKTLNYLFKKINTNEKIELLSDEKNNQEKIKSLFIVESLTYFKWVKIYESLTEGSRTFIAKLNKKSEKELHKSLKFELSWVFFVGWSIIIPVLLSLTPFILIFAIIYKALQPFKRNEKLTYGEIGMSYCDTLLNNPSIRLKDLKNVTKFRLEMEDAFDEKGTLIDLEVYNLNYKI